MVIVPAVTFSLSVPNNPKALFCDDPDKAEEVRLKLRRLQDEHLLDLEDAVVAVKDRRARFSCTKPLT